MLNLRKSLLILGVATALVTTPNIATAAESSPDATEVATTATSANTSPLTAASSASEAQALSNLLNEAGLPSVTTNLLSRQQTTYTLPSGSTIVVQKPRSTTGTSLMWSVGVGWGVYIYLNQSDQRVLLAGGSAALSAAICGVSGGISCVGSAAALAAATQWINDRGGICTGTKKRLEIHILGETNFKCVK